MNKLYIPLALICTLLFTIASSMIILGDSGKTGGLFLPDAIFAVGAVASLKRIK